MNNPSQIKPNPAQAKPNPTEIKPKSSQILRAKPKPSQAKPSQASPGQAERNLCKGAWSATSLVSSPLVGLEGGPVGDGARVPYDFSELGIS